jgi:hypothetical protein
VASAYGWVTIVILSMVKRAHPSYSNILAIFKEKIAIFCKKLPKNHGSMGKNHPS